MKQWKKYVGYDQWDQYNAGHQSANPGPIDNAKLFKGTSLQLISDGISDSSTMFISHEGLLLYSVIIKQLHNS